MNASRSIGSFFEEIVRRQKSVSGTVFDNISIRAGRGGQILDGENLANQPNAREKIARLILLRKRLGTKDWILFLFKALLLYTALYYIFEFVEWHILNTFQDRATRKRL